MSSRSHARATSAPKASAKRKQKGDAQYFAARARPQRVGRAEEHERVLVGQREPDGRGAGVLGEARPSGAAQRQRGRPLSRHNLGGRQGQRGGRALRGPHEPERRWLLEADGRRGAGPRGRSRPGLQRQPELQVLLGADGRRGAGAGGRARLDARRRDGGPGELRRPVRLQLLQLPARVRGRHPVHPDAVRREDVPGGGHPDRAGAQPARPSPPSGCPTESSGTSALRRCS